MGYRLEVKCNGMEVYTGKFYGYVELDNLKSIKWLLDNKREDIVTDDDPIPIYMFDVCDYGPEITLTSEEFKVWLRLYNDDINEYNFTGHYISYPENYDITEQYEELKEILKMPYDKVLFWC